MTGRGVRSQVEGANDLQEEDFPFKDAISSKDKECGMRASKGTSNFQVIFTDR